MLQVLAAVNQYFAGRNFFRVASALSASSLIAQLLFLLTISLLTRLYGERELGVFFLVYSLHAIGTPLLTLRFDALILHEKNPKIAAKLFQYAVNLNAIFVLAGLICLPFVVRLDFVLLGKIKLFEIVLAAVCSSLASVYILICSYFSRNTVYRPQITSRILGAVSFLLITTLTPVRSSNAIVIAFLSSLLLQNITCHLSSCLPKIDLLFVCRKKTNLFLASKIKYSFLMLVPSSFADMLSQQMPVYFITVSLGLIPLSYYSISQRIAMFPISLIAPSIVSAYAPQLLKSEQKRKLFIGISKKLVLIAFLCYLLLYFGAPLFIHVFTGAYSQQPINVLRAMLLTGFVILSSSLVSPTLLSLKVKYAPSICAFSALIYRPLAFVLGLKMFSSLASACLVYSVAEATQILITSIYTCNRLSLVSQKK